MRIHFLLVKWFVQRFGSRARPRVRRRSQRARLCLEQLETRYAPASIAPISDFVTPNGKTLLVPLTILDPSGNPVSYDVQSDDPNVSVSLMPGSGVSVRMNVTGVDGNGNSFDGFLTFRLFETFSPLATQRIIDLVNANFYDGRVFHRVIDGFMAQGGSVNGLGGGFLGPDPIDDEFDVSLTFNSPGLVAFANAGDDGNDTGFFIVDIDLSLAEMPQHLNFNHTIFGQLTDGFDIFARLMSTDVTNNPQTGELSFPTNTVTIVSAEILIDTTNAVLRVSAPAGFQGTTRITVMADDGGAAIPDVEFDVTFVDDAINDRPFIDKDNLPAVIETQIGTGVTFQAPAIDLENDPLTFIVTDPNNFGVLPPEVANVLIDHATGTISITSAQGFVGSVELLIGVRDPINRGGNLQSQFDTQRITLNVVGNIDLNTDSDTGPLSDDNVTGDATPSFTIVAPAGVTVNIQVNGGDDIPATETGTPGVYEVTLPPNLLNVGENTITAQANGDDLMPLTITYAPRLQTFYVVPGERGMPQAVDFSFVYKESDFNNEVGVFPVDDLEGRVDGLLPGDVGYAAAALSRAQVLFTPLDTPNRNSARTRGFEGGDILAFFLIQNNTLANHVAQNPTNNVNGSPLAFFSITAANPDGVAHVHAVDDPLRSQVVYAWEDLTFGGDQDFNDFLLAVRPAGMEMSEAIRVATANDRIILATFGLQTAQKSALNPNQAPISSIGGELGLFVVDDAQGRIGGLSPSDPGYAAAALNSDRQVIFSMGTTAGTDIDLFLPGGAFLGFYFIPNGTTEDFLATNPNNTPGTAPQAFFSFAAANPNGIDHFRVFNPEGVSQSIPNLTDPIRLHVMGALNGTANDFDDVVFTLAFA
ncbi:MAG: DUF4114 domain-containing protein [Gemmataceae bacterium]